ncbi:class E sortase [Streptomyces smaragdinus]|uniref:class E sortase n=1 Tax=Streptomyces smaragdinus TaxID=2585196 RepID=UPI00389B057A
MTDNSRGTGPRVPSWAAGPPRRPRRGLVASVVSLTGELLITIGVLLALFVAYSLWWTNVQANREAGRLSDHLRDSWQSGAPGALDTDGGLGFLHVPAMAQDVLVRAGTGTKVLNEGVAGFYEKPVKSAMPWDKAGNFTLAAHRDGHGAKFHNIHKIDVGDPIVFETKDTWYVYKTYATLPETSKYNTDVLAPVPKESGREKPGRYITLTTCTPMYTSEHRYIVWGELVRTEKVDAARTPPAELRD